MSRLPLLSADVDRIARSARGELDGPALPCTLDRDQPHVGDTPHAGQLANRAFGGLNGEGVARAPPVGGQVDLAAERALEQRPRLRRPDAAVEDTVGQGDEVAGEPVATDVRRLPHPLLVDLLAHGGIERPAELRAATVVLPMRADEEEGVVDGVAGACELDSEQIVVVLELEPSQLALRLGRPRYEGREPVPATTLGAPDEEDTALREQAPLLGEVGLQRVGEDRADDRVVGPETAVLDQDPRIDAARRGCERLGVGERDLGTE